MRKRVLVHNQNRFDGSPHPDHLVLVLHPLESFRNRLVLFGLRFFGAERVVGQWEHVDGSVERRFFGEIWDGVGHGSRDGCPLDWWPLVFHFSCWKLKNLKVLS